MPSRPTIIYIYRVQNSGCTETSALQWLFTKHNLEGDLWRYIQTVFESIFTVHHRPGKESVVVDALNRVKAARVD